MKKQGIINGELAIDGDLELTDDLTVEKWIEVSGSIYCNDYSIKAGGFIETGDSIKAGSAIDADFGILAQTWINCKTTLKANYKIFAGIKTWSAEILDEEKTIICGKLIGGTIEYGILKETGLDEIDDKTEEAIKLLEDKGYRIIK